jgi:hypothetical protein
MEADIPGIRAISFITCQRNGTGTSRCCWLHAEIITRPRASLRVPQRELHRRWPAAGDGDDRCLGDPELIEDFGADVRLFFRRAAGRERRAQIAGTGDSYKSMARRDRRFCQQNSLVVPAHGAMQRQHGGSFSPANGVYVSPRSADRDWAQLFTHRRNASVGTHTLLLWFFEVDG